MMNLKTIKSSSIKHIINIIIKVCMAAAKLALLAFSSKLEYKLLKFGILFAFSTEDSVTSYLSINWQFELVMMMMMMMKYNALYRNQKLKFQVNITAYFCSITMGSPNQGRKEE
jgi:hypothetical protein